MEGSFYLYLPFLYAHLYLSYSGYIIAIMFFFSLMKLKYEIKVYHYLLAPHVLVETHNSDPTNLLTHGLILARRPGVLEPRDASESPGGLSLTPRMSG